MKKFFLSLVAAAISHIIAISQPCLPEGIYFSTQEQIDNFQINYPECTEIEGNVEISNIYPSGITNLNGLNVITSVGGYLWIYQNQIQDFTGLNNLISIGTSMKIEFNHSLKNFTGLNSLTTIGGNLEIWGNDSLMNFNGLNNLLTVGYNLTIGYYSETPPFGVNPLLENISGLSSLSYIGGTFQIENNPILNDLSGLENLTYVGWNFRIINNSSLTSIEGLHNLNTVNGDLLIYGNASLTSLSGIENIEQGLINDLNIVGNSSLSECWIQSICDYLASPNGVVNIGYNDTGCNSIIEVSTSCGMTSMPCLPFGNYMFINQSDIDNFQSNYPGCTELEGNVGISGENINNLLGINSILSIGNFFSIQNTSLTNFDGLENLVYAGSLFIQENDSVLSLNGLQNLAEIGGQFNIGNNTQLNDLTALQNLNAIGGYLIIYNNDNVVNLLGLQNILPQSISHLEITSNQVLSQCDIQSVCDYLVDPNGSVFIYDNATGCNSPEEVEEHCLTTVEELETGNGITIIPIPSNDNITLSSPLITGNTQLLIINVSGEKVLERQLTDTETQIDISALPRGAYFVRVHNKKMVEVTKVVKQ